MLLLSSLYSWWLLLISSWTREVTVCLQVTGIFVGLTNHFAIFFFFFIVVRAWALLFGGINSGVFVFVFGSIVYGYFLSITMDFWKDCGSFVVEEIRKLIDLSLYIFQISYIHLSSVSWHFPTGLLWQASLGCIMLGRWGGAKRN